MKKNKYTYTFENVSNQNKHWDSPKCPKCKNNRWRTESTLHNTVKCRNCNHIQERK